MKLSLAFLLGLSVATSSVDAQSTIDSLTYEQTQDIAFTSHIRNSTDIKVYKSKGEYVFKPGDTLAIGSPSTNENAFSYIYAGKLTVGKVFLTGAQYLSGHLKGEKVIIDQIYVYHSRGSKNSVLSVNMFLISPNWPKAFNHHYRTVGDVERALELGELTVLNAPITREQAIAKLKESKDLLELGVIDEKKYDSLKDALTPYIIR